MTSFESAPSGSLPRAVGLGLGVAAVLATLLLDPPRGLPEPGWRTAGVAALMAAWWIFEAAPLAATALVPLALFPVLGAGGIGDAAAPYANPLVFLFLGGFVLALGMERRELHRRLALRVISAVGGSSTGLIGGFMIGTAFVSLWVSNTATALMMLPIALSVAELRGGPARAGAGDDRFGAALVLGVAYAASIGGMGTLIGTPPNALLAGFVREAYGVEIGFARWLAVGLPLVVLALPLTFLLLTRLVLPSADAGRAAGRGLVEAELRALGPLSRPEVLVSAVVATVALLWVTRPLLERALPGLSDAGIAIAGALLMFLLPAAPGERLLEWSWAQKRLPWDVLLLFGGGLSLAAGLERSGVSEWVGHSLAGLGSWPPLLLVAVVVAAVVLLSELASNTATAAVLLPIAGAASEAVGRDPLFLAVPVALAASCGFALPVATPPNAIAYGTRRVTIRQMAAAGLLLDLVMVGLVTLATLTWIPAVLGTGR